jgi:hypothetical protein
MTKRPAAFILALSCTALVPLTHAVLVMPDLADNYLPLSGDVASGYGITGYMRYDVFAPDAGHIVQGMVQNAPFIPHPGRPVTANYYLSGRAAGPMPDGGVNDAVAGAPVGMATTSAYVVDNALNIGQLTLRFGATTGNPEHSWNLGADERFIDWFGEMASPIEQRIYQANPAQVESALYYNGTKILVFGYSPIYEILDYGPTDAEVDDVIQAYSDPVAAEKVAGLDPLRDGLADALLADIAAGGGLVQLRFDTAQRITEFFPTSADPDFLIASQFAFGGVIQVVPEPSQIGLVVGLLAIGWLIVRRRRA